MLVGPIIVALERQLVGRRLAVDTLAVGELQVAGMHVDMLADMLAVAAVAGTLIVAGKLAVAGTQALVVDMLAVLGMHFQGCTRLCKDFDSHKRTFLYIVVIFKNINDEEHPQ